MTAAAWWAFPAAILGAIAGWDAWAARRWRRHHHDNGEGAGR